MRRQGPSISTIYGVLCSECQWTTKDWKHAAARREFNRPPPTPPTNGGLPAHPIARDRRHHAESLTPAPPPPVSPPARACAGLCVCVPGWLFRPICSFCFGSSSPALVASIRPRNGPHFLFSSSPSSLLRSWNIPPPVVAAPLISPFCDSVPFRSRGDLPTVLDSTSRSSSMAFIL
ncbi:hypothetical protein BO71DRAFT_220664 [Aspergillus ellipticus CBS 707.79]|uniref:Uncharacterized protein n=1 Tax=Aspergillus ellipticus CBS 707.79 TaxID=1448320 RepID=A0A319DCA5_9EURO|nr:hypothetical protein BO71DRAFT_220664 [Aspergillus ellipticus CBS 707.79]